MEGYIVEAKEKIIDAFAGLDVFLSDEQAEKFYDYWRLLIEWNEKINLTAITDFNQVLLKHFIDSCALCKVVNLNDINLIIDVGTGAGFPGIPLKILYPHLKVTLLDSLNKRIVFLKEVVKKIFLDNVETIHGRAEEIGHMAAYREQYDLCVSRAVANLPVLMEYCIPFVRTEGIFVSYKSGDIDNEVEQAQNAAKILHSSIESVPRMILPNSDLSRSFVIMKKNGTLDEKYPRRAGIPTKSPL